MIHTLLNVLYVLVAIAMIVLILLQRGAGAQAGSGFGAGASGTVFGARGSANFLSTSTKWLAGVFFGLSLFMAWQASHNANISKGPVKPDLGVMADLPAASDKPAAPAAGTPLPAPVLPAAAAPAPVAPAPVIAPPASTPAPATSSGENAKTIPAGDGKGG